MLQYLPTLQPCTVGIEACGTAHHWARTIGAMGHTVKLIQPMRVKAFLGQRNKTDAADAKAICEALMHPGTTFVRIKTLEQQDMDHLLDRRQRLIEERTRIVNQTRAFLAERGIVIPHYCPIKFSVLGPMLWYCGLFEYQSLCGHDFTLANVY